MSNKAANVVERSLAVSITPRRERKRRAELLAIEFGPKRVAALALHNMAIKHPDFAVRLFGLSKNDNPSPVIGAGADSVVYKVSSKDVVKVHTATVGQTTSEQRARVDNMNDLHRIMTQYLGAFSVPQHSSIGTHPAFPDIPVVTTHQAFFDIANPRLFAGCDTEVNADSWDRLCTLAPETAQTVIDLSTASLDCFSETQIMPDVVGKGNLALVGSDYSLMLIDGHPIKPANTRAVNRSYERLRSMADLKL